MLQSSATVTVTELITTSVFGLSPPPVGTFDVEALHDLTEQAVGGRQADAGRAGHDEELAAVGVRTGVRHGDRADLVLTRLGQFVVEAVAGTATTGAGRIAALAHEAVDDPVEDHAVVVVVQRQEHEVVDRRRRLDGVERNHDLTEARIELCGVNAVAMGTRLPADVSAPVE